VDSFIVGGLVLALIVINNAAYTPECWQGTLLTWVTVIAVASLQHLLREAPPTGRRNLLYCPFIRLCVGNHLSLGHDANQADGLRGFHTVHR
jgi:hypothetical protein